MVDWSGREGKIEECGSLGGEVQAPRPSPVCSYLGKVLVSYSDIFPSRDPHMDNTSSILSESKYSRDCQPSDTKRHKPELP